MNKFQERRCRECGEGMVRLVAKPGRRTTYKFLELDVPADLAIPTCDHCGMEWHNDATAERFDEAMEQVFRRELTGIAQRALEHIDNAGVRQSEVERAIGLSPGYLSKIKRGERTPEPVLVAQLAIISMNPSARLSEAQKVWTTKLAS
jgi:hypothetical protein